MRLRLGRARIALAAERVERGDRLVRASGLLRERRLGARHGAFQRVGRVSRLRVQSRLERGGARFGGGELFSRLASRRLQRRRRVRLRRRDGVADATFRLLRGGGDGGFGALEVGGEAIGGVALARKFRLGRLRRLRRRRREFRREFLRETRLRRREIFRETRLHRGELRLGLGVALAEQLDGGSRRLRLERLQRRLALAALLQHEILGVLHVTRHLRENLLPLIRAQTLHHVVAPHPSLGESRAETRELILVRLSRLGRLRVARRASLVQRVAKLVNLPQRRRELFRLRAVPRRLVRLLQLLAKTRHLARVLLRRRLLRGGHRGFEFAASIVVVHRVVRRALERFARLGGLRALRLEHRLELRLELRRRLLRGGHRGFEFAASIVVLPGERVQRRAVREALERFARLGGRRALLLQLRLELSLAFRLGFGHVRHLRAERLGDGGGFRSRLVARRLEPPLLLTRHVQNLDVGSRVRRLAARLLELRLEHLDGVHLIAHRGVGCAKRGRLLLGRALAITDKRRDSLANVLGEFGAPLREILEVSDQTANLRVELGIRARELAGQRGFARDAGEVLDELEAESLAAGGGEKVSAEPIGVVSRDGDADRLLEKLEEGNLLEGSGDGAGGGGEREGGDGRAPRGEHVGALAEIVRLEALERLVELVGDRLGDGERGWERGGGTVAIDRFRARVRETIGGGSGRGRGGGGGGGGGSRLALPHGALLDVECGGGLYGLGGLDDACGLLERLAGERHVHDGRIR